MRAGVQGTQERRRQPRLSGIMAAAGGGGGLGHRLVPRTLDVCANVCRWCLAYDGVAWPIVVCTYRRHTCVHVLVQRARARSGLAAQGARLAHVSLCVPARERGTNSENHLAGRFRSGQVQVSKRLSVCSCRACVWQRPRCRAALRARAAALSGAVACPVPPRRGGEERAQGRGTAWRAPQHACRRVRMPERP